MPSDNPLILQLQLSIPSLIGDAENDSTKRREDTAQAAAQLFRYAKAVFGEVAARQMWIAVAKARRGPKGPRDPERDRKLLDEYDKAVRNCASEAARAKLPRRIGMLFDILEPARYGNSPEAITKHLLRLRDRRQRQEDKKMQCLPSGSQPAME
jgi:hypothetical protein